ncbi:MAG: hypothetical protein KatS3mg031_0476 [Chitinophagales bacterium]|nr:MAG: hypothetical protein KatS3mg031_0476 [Chitinophagales bacterium]
MARDILQELHNLLNQSPDDPFILFALAQEYGKRSQLDAALSYYLQLITAFPDYTGTYYHLGKIYERLGQYDNAIKTYQKGMDITQKKGDQHAYTELKAALSSITSEDEFQ